MHRPLKWVLLLSVLALAALPVTALAFWPPRTNSPTNMTNIDFERPDACTFCVCAVIQCPGPGVHRSCICVRAKDCNYATRETYCPPPTRPRSVVRGDR